MSDQFSVADQAVCNTVLMVTSGQGLPGKAPETYG